MSLGSKHLSGHIAECSAQHILTWRDLELRRLRLIQIRGRGPKIRLPQKLEL